MKANNHWGVILVAASNKTTNSPCELKKDEKLIAPVYSVIPLSESSLKHHKSVINFFLHLPLYVHTVLFALQVLQQLEYIYKPSKISRVCIIWMCFIYFCSVYSLTLCL